MKRNIFALLSLLVAASMLLAACGGAPEATEAAATEAPATEAAATEEVMMGPVGTEPIPFPDGGKSVTGAFDQEPDAVVPYFTQMSYAVWVAQ